MSMMVSGRSRILRRRSRIHFSFISRVMVSASSGYILSNIYSIVKRKDGWKMFPSVLLDRTRSKKNALPERQLRKGVVKEDMKG